MELIGLWMVAGLMVLSAIVFGWLTITAHPMASEVSRRREHGRREDLVRRECADLDDEYRQLLNS